MSEADEKMSYLYGFIEETASLASDLRGELANIRELDLVVQNAKDEVEKLAFVFFQNAPTMHLEKRHSAFQSVLSKFTSILEVADEKVNTAQRLENVLRERLVQLDREIVTFKVELETENPGVTEIIQERVLINERVKHKRMFNDKLRKVRKIEIHKKKRATDTPTKKLRVNAIFQDEQMQRTIAYESVKLNNDTTDGSKIYCICNLPTFGDTIACDNVLCPHEWFHYGCLNMKTLPEGKWYCPKCVVCKVDLERLTASKYLKL